MTSLFQRSSRHRGWLPVLGPVALAATLTAGCAASGTTPSPASSGSSGPARSASRSAAFSQCLKEHGVTPPAGFGQGGGFGRGPGSGNGSGGGQGGSRPHARPTGAAASAFRNAMKACGATGFPGGGGPAG